MTVNTKRAALGLSLAAVVGIATACSSQASSSDHTGAAGASSPSTRGPASSSGANAKTLAAAQQAVTQYMQNPTFTAPGPPIDTRAVAGKTVFNIPQSSSNAFLNAVDSAAQQAAQAAGMKWVNCQNQGTPSEYVKCFDQAISSHPSVILIDSIAGAQIEPQLKRAAAAGIPTVIEHLYDQSFQLPANVTAFSFAPFIKAAKLEADYTATSSQCHGHVLVLTTNDFPPSQPQAAELSKEFAAVCGTKLEVTIQNVPFAQWQTGLASTTQTALTTHPDIDYVIPLYDSMVELMLPGIQAANRASSVKIVTYNGTPAILKYIADKNVVVADVGEDPQAIGFAGMDQVFRLASGAKPASNEVTGLKIFDGQNIAQAGTPPALGVGYGSSFKNGYYKLWGLS